VIEGLFDFYGWRSIASYLVCNGDPVNAKKSPGTLKSGKESAVRHPMIILAAITLSMAVATNALAAGPAGGAGHSGGRIGGFVPPVEGPVPALPAPTFNPSEPYTMPESPEVHVSPGSPGSIFGNR
jgi:hypothetical protein